MNSSVSPTAQTTAAIERILKVVLDEVANAYLHGDRPLLQTFGVHPRDAETIDRLDRLRLARDIVASPTSGINIEFNDDILDCLMSRSEARDKKDRQIRQLMNLGSTQTMLTDLGFHINSDGGSQKGAVRGLCQTHPTGFPFGRPPVLEDDMIRALDDYWGSIPQPGRICPIDHLIRAADHLDLRVVSIWNYIKGFPDITKKSSLPGSPDWIYVLFPDWPNQKKNTFRYPR